MSTDGLCTSHYGRRAMHGGYVFAPERGRCFGEQLIRNASNCLMSCWYYKSGVTCSMKLTNYGRAGVSYLGGGVLKVFCVLFYVLISPAYR